MRRVEKIYPMFLKKRNRCDIMIGKAKGKGVGKMKGFVSIRSFDYKKRRRQTVGGLVSEASTPVDIWHLPPPADDFGSAVTVVSLKDDKDSKKNQTFLINCGSSDRAVVKYLVPALSRIGIKVSDIDVLVFTDCSPDSMGGVHKLRQLCPDIKVLTNSSQGTYQRNPSYRFMQYWEDYIDYSPAYREMRGMLPSADNIQSLSYTKLQPIRLQGVMSDALCWYCPDWNLLICGELLQNGGSEITDVACIENAELYRISLEYIYETRFETLLCSKKQKKLPYIISGLQNCRDAVSRSLDVLSEYNRFITAYASKKHIKKENIDIEDLTEEYIKVYNKKPAKQGYAMRTFDFLIHPEKYKQKFSS